MRLQSEAIGLATAPHTRTSIALGGKKLNTAARNIQPHLACTAAMKPFVQDERRTACIRIYEEVPTQAIAKQDL